MNFLQRALIEKTGNDHGFEYVVGSEVDCVTMASARHPNRVSVRMESGVYRVRFETSSQSLLPELQRSFPVSQIAGAFEVNTEAELAATARGLLHWHATHGFCAVCGSAGPVVVRFAAYSLSVSR